MTCHARLPAPIGPIQLQQPEPGFKACVLRSQTLTASSRITGRWLRERSTSNCSCRETLALVWSCRSNFFAWWLCLFLQHSKTPGDQPQYQQKKPTATRRKSQQASRRCKLLLGASDCPELPNAAIYGMKHSHRVNGHTYVFPQTTRKTNLPAR